MTKPADCNERFFFFGDFLNWQNKLKLVMTQPPKAASKPEAAAALPGTEVWVNKDESEFLTF